MYYVCTILETCCGKAVMQNEELKEKVREYWDENTCGTNFTNEEKYTKEYFDDIEQTRYEIHPEVFNFAQFSRFYGKKILEVGIGAGTDFIQWVRSGAEAYGIDLTPEAIKHVQTRLEVYGLEAAEIKVSDAENLDYPDNMFDLAYSFGVIHHSPNTPKALDEIIRVIKPGGAAKIMIYNRHSLLAYFFWIKHALLKFKPWKSIRWVLWNHMESLGTKAYTVNEVKDLLRTKPVTNVSVTTMFTYYDRLARFSPLIQRISRFVASLLGRDKTGWFLIIEFTKK